MAHVLVVDDEEILAKTICRFLKKRQIDATYATTAAEAIQLFSKGDRPAITFVDYRIGRDSGVDLLSNMRRTDPAANIVMMTGHGDIHVAVNAMKAGASDFLIKPVPLDDIAEVANIALRSHSPVQANPGSPANEEILGRSAATARLRATIDRILEATRDLQHNLPSVLITGESGTGKELVARALHANGTRADKPFIPVNCASLPAELIESELFGHERGAFTDAKGARTGLFEAADGGIIFLDEIGDMPMDAQAKLLRVLEERTVRRIGAEHAKPIDVWVIAATNQHLAELVSAGKFRGDLMFRLQVIWVEVPPLCERDSDVIHIATHMLEDFARQYGKPVSRLTAEARARLVEHQWPGNVRELRNVMERAVIMADGGPIDARHIALTGSGDTKPGNDSSLLDMERSMLEKALNQSNGNVTRAAAILGISRDTMRYRIDKFGLSPKRRVS